MTSRASGHTKEKKTAKAKTPSRFGVTQGPPDFLLELLRYEYSRRVQKNARFSQRSFAKHLGVSHTLLSLVMNGHRLPSRQLLETLSERLNYSPEKSALLMEALKARKNQAVETESRVETADLAYEKVSLDQFALISEWQHYAILSLLELKDTAFEPKFIAQRLGINPLIAKVSMQRLVDLGIVIKNAKGQWKQKSGPIIVENTRSTEATRKFQRQMLNKALESMLNDPIEVRDLSSTTFSMNSKRVPFALQRIREFRRQLTQELEAFGDPDEVYNLTVQLFPASRRSSK